MYIALLSDIHSNIFALDAVYKDLEEKDISKILITGDLIGYYYWPKEVITKVMRDKRVACISGNHEEILAESMNCTIKAAEYRKKYGSGYDVCIKELSNSQLHWLLSLPKTLSLEIEGISFFLAHGSLHSASDYIYPDAPKELLDKNYTDALFTVFGNTHYPFTAHNGKNTIINPGSVGQPRDLSGIASYALVNTQNQSITFRRVSFERGEIISAAQKYDPEISYLQTIMFR
ncbi:metallophosphatase family protein [Gammaproteobacteria bacterium]|nr:metallophosphatase family protein [Gammaproteobacteria bacterium]